jgi:hypothetical protein
MRSPEAHQIRVMGLDGAEVGDRGGEPVAVHEVPRSVAVAAGTWLGEREVDHGAEHQDGSERMPGGQRIPMNQAAMQGLGAASSLLERRGAGPVRSNGDLNRSSPANEERRRSGNGAVASGDVRAR